MARQPQPCRDDKRHHLWLRGNNNTIVPRSASASEEEYEEAASRRCGKHHSFRDTRTPDPAHLPLFSPPLPARPDSHRHLLQPSTAINGPGRNPRAARRISHIRYVELHSCRILKVQMLTTSVGRDSPRGVLQHPAPPDPRQREAAATPKAVTERRLVVKDRPTAEPMGSRAGPMQGDARTQQHNIPGLRVHVRYGSQSRAGLGRMTPDGTDRRLPHVPARYMPPPDSDYVACESDHKILCIPHQARKRTQGRLRTRCATARAQRHQIEFQKETRRKADARGEGRGRCARRRPCWRVKVCGGSVAAAAGATEPLAACGRHAGHDSAMHSSRPGRPRHWTRCLGVCTRRSYLTDRRTLLRTTIRCKLPS
ncbi:hypothetical protein PLESTF_000442500 [Pleodorina starrii]|nr:hypothetical protein PLESTF_000442500 [Pleodorina starrii]